jgi:ATP-dependent exoDNAse (exonuclease V) beta subunit
MLELIEANAGAGKTTTIVKRYVELLKRFPVESIVLVTFTESAGGDLRERARLEIENSKDPRVKKALLYLPSAPIGTIHSFCLELLRRFGFRYGLFSLDTTVASAIEVERILTDVTVNVLKEFQKKHFSRLNKVLFLIDYDKPRAFRRLMSFLKTVILHRTRFPISKTNFSVDDMVENVKKLFESAFDERLEIKPEVLEREKNMASFLLELSAETIKEFENQLERDNLIDYSGILIKARKLVKHRKAIEEIANTYNAIIVDEFQDTDPVQWDIIKALLERKPHLQVVLVGDPKQSIYRFRSAGLFIWEDAKRLADRTESKVENYRSAKKLLLFFNRLFNDIYNKKRGKLLCELRFENFQPSEKTPNEGEVILFPFHLKKEMERFVEFSIGASLKYAVSGSVGVIARRWNELKPFEQHLKALGVDFSYASASPSKALGVQELLHLLRWMADPSDKESLFMVLSSRIVGLPHTEAMKAVLGNSENEDVREFLSICEDARKLIDSELHSVFILNLLSKLNFLDALYMTDYDSYVSILEIVNEVYEFEKLEPVPFKEVVSYIERLATFGDTGYSKGKFVPKKGYTLTTIHSAKGLEFDSVIVVPEWLPTPPKGGFLYTNTGFAVKLFSAEGKPEESPYFHMLKELDRYLDNLEDKNLLYVAVTRAKKQLIVGAGNQGKRLKIGGVSVDRKDYEDLVVRKEVEISLPAVPEEENDAKVLPSALSKPLQAVKPSEHKPVVFEGRNPYAPEGVSSKEYGIAVHALCQAFAMGAEEKTAVNFALSHLPARTSRKMENRLKELFRLLLQQHRYLRTNTQVEVPFVFKDGETVVKGRIDLVRHLENCVEVWDFKTGTYTPEKEKAYREQLLLYAKALENCGYKVASANLFFIDENKVVRLNE